MHGLTALDEDDNVIRPAIWQDSFDITETGFIIGRERKFYDYHEL